MNFLVEYIGVMDLVTVNLLSTRKTQIATNWDSYIKDRKSTTGKIRQDKRVRKRYSDMLKVNLGNG